MNGLTIKNGRLINNRPDSMTGIQEACMIKKSMKMDKEASIVAKGIERAEMLKSFRDNIKKF
jgi:hypothetical protein